MRQTALWSALETAERVFVDDETGRIVYIPGVVHANEAAVLFTQLRAHVAWRADERWMYEKIVRVPRLVSGGYRTGAELHPLLRELQSRVEERLGVHFNSVALNLYRDGKDSVAWHNDTLTELINEPTIALVTLGATRRMQIRSKCSPRNAFALDLDAGSLFVMSGASQRHWEHRVPKEARALGERISIAFRQRPQTPETT